MTTVYADSGINWEFIYEIVFEDADILVLKDLGRYHKYDIDRMWTAPIKAYIEIRGDFAYCPDWGRKLVEVQK